MPSEKNKYIFFIYFSDVNKSVHPFHVIAHIKKNINKLFIFSINKDNTKNCTFKKPNSTNIASITVMYKILLRLQHHTTERPLQQ